jgi:hypothetical protein
MFLKFIPENRAVYETMWKKYGPSGQVKNDKITAHALCMLDG